MSAVAVKGTVTLVFELVLDAEVWVWALQWSVYAHIWAAHTALVGSKPSARCRLSIRRQAHAGTHEHM